MTRISPSHDNRRLNNVKKLIGIAVVTACVSIFSFSTKANAGRDNTNRKNGVNVISATYGGTIVPIYNWCGPVAEGNATGAVHAACQGRKNCDYTVNVGILGDPAPGCWKSFSVTYQCAQNANATRTVSVGGYTGEANGQTVTMSCPL